VTAAGLGLEPADDESNEEPIDEELPDVVVESAVPDDVADTVSELEAAGVALGVDEKAGELIVAAEEDEATAVGRSVVVDVGTPLLSTSTDTDRVRETSTVAVTTPCRSCNARRSFFTLRAIFSGSLDNLWRLDGGSIGKSSRGILQSRLTKSFFFQISKLEICARDMEVCSRSTTCIE